MRHYAGLDVSLEETAICIVDEMGKVVRELRAASEPDALIETRAAKAAMGAMPNKTDRNDARGLAQIMRTGWYRAVHVKSTPSRSARALLGARRTMLNKQRDIENAVRAVLREVGLKLGTPSRKLFACRVRELASADAAISDIVEPLLAVVDAMAHQIARLTKHALDAVKVEPICRRLMTVPGVGPLTALAFRATVDQPERFRRARAHRAVRGSAHLADALPEMVDAQGLGDAHRPTPRHGQGPCRRGAQAGRHPASHVERRRRVPLGQACPEPDERRASPRSSMRRHEPDPA